MTLLINNLIAQYPNIKLEHIDSGVAHLSIYSDKKQHTLLAHAQLTLSTGHLNAEHCLSGNTHRAFIRNVFQLTQTLQTIGCAKLKNNIKTSIWQCQLSEHAA
jgi:hypothetical protein